MFVNTCMVAKYVIINWEMFSMKKVNNDTVFGILQLETLLGDINSIFSEIESEYKMSQRRNFNFTNFMAKRFYDA